MAVHLRRRNWLILFAAFNLAVGAAAWLLVIRPVFWGDGGPAAPERFQRTATGTAFVELAAAAGFTHVHHKPQLDPKLEPIMPWVSTVGAAAAAGDYDNDGWMDLYVTDSRKGFPNRLYRNQGDGAFVDVAPQAGVADVNGETGASMDTVWGDYDNDGRLDLFVVKWGRDQLFRNNGDGTFQDVTARAFRNERGRPGSRWANGCSAVWVDYDGDSRLDLYVGNYFAPFDLWNLPHTRIMHDDFEKARNAGRNFLFHNNGDGTFTEVSAKLKLDDPGWTLSVGHGDINNDGWPDIYNANDFGPDQAFLNLGDGTFRNISNQAFGEDTKKGMNVDFGDFDGNGWLDIYVTNITTAEYLKEGNMLWNNDASGEDGVPVFLDVSFDTLTYDGGWGWGAKFFDFDNDGDLDIIALNGFISAGEENYWYDLASWTVTDEDVSDALNWPPIGDRSFSGYEATRLWRNEGRLRFSEVARQAGVDDRSDGRGVVVFDSDNDGDLDLYLANQGTKPSFFRNEVGAGGHWLALRLIGRPESGSNRDAIGGRVTVVTADGRQIREMEGGNSFCGQSDRRIYFGLGDRMIVDTLEIRWPSRRVQVLRDLSADRILEIEEPAELPVVASLIPTGREPVVSESPANGPSSRAALPEPEERDRLLSELEERIREKPKDVILAGKYRLQSTRFGEHQRSIRFFERVAGEHPAISNVRLQLSAAYVDTIPTCGGISSVVCKGRLARKGLEQMDMVLADVDDWWPAVYARAINHLHWPRALLHSAASARDFRKLVELQNAGEPDGRSYYVRAHIGLGDALAKDGRFAEARKAWKEGSVLFPSNRDLRGRLALKTSGKALAFVERVRNLERPIDTDFSFLLSP